MFRVAKRQPAARLAAIREDSHASISKQDKSSVSGNKSSRGYLFVLSCNPFNLCFDKLKADVIL